MIKQLHIENIGPYQDETFNFHPGINIVIGEGCNGKTYGIVRPLKLLRYFRPINFKFHSNFSKDNFSNVSVTTFDNHIISLYRHKDPSKSIYSITYPNGKKEEFRRFNKTVPDLIINTLNLNDLNFQFQLDSPYIISESPGKITKIINSITKINDVDEWVKKLNSIIRECDRDIKNKNEEFNDNKKELEKLSNIESIGKKIKKLKKMEKQITKLELEQDEIEELIDDIDNLENKRIKLNKNLKLEDKYKKLLKLELEIEKLDDTMEEINEYVELENKLMLLKKELKIALKEYIKQLKKKEMCPTCFNKIDNKTIDRIKANLK